MYGMEELTIDHIKELKGLMELNQCKPKTVKTDKQAREFTKNDPLGREWKKSDKYFMLYTYPDGQHPV